MTYFLPARASVWIIHSLLALCLIGESSFAETPAETRPEMKRRLQELKRRTSRIPLPPLTPEEIAAGKSSVNNGRLRSIYLPQSWRSFVIPGWGGQRQPRATGANVSSTLNALQRSPDYAFKTQLFWIVSRTNDCQYCLGHQELKLKRVGLSDDQIASLDCRWDLFTEGEQAAMRAARKLTITPHLFGESDILEMKTHHSDSELIDLLYTVARYNSVNRWTSSTGIPQDNSFGGEETSELDTPTSEEFSKSKSKVAPFDHEPRPEWEPRAEVEKLIEEAKDRKPLVQLPPLDKAANVLSVDTPGANPPMWFRAISGISTAVEAWAQRQALVRDGQTKPDLRVKIAWVSARENRAWYAAGHALARARALGLDETAFYHFDTLVDSSTPADAVALKFVRKLTTAPHTIEDTDVESLRKEFTDHEVAEIIHLTGDANAFDRFTESIRLPLEF